MRFAKCVFLLAGVSSILMVVPLYFLERQTGEDYPPPITHPESDYGFFGVTLAWQFTFRVIATDPARYRRAMLPAMLEKANFAVAVPLLYAAGRVGGVWIGFAAMDATWLVLFVVASLRTPNGVAPGRQALKRGANKDGRMSIPETARLCCCPGEDGGRIGTLRLATPRG